MLKKIVDATDYKVMPRVVNFSLNYITHYLTGVGLMTWNYLKDNSKVGMEFVESHLDPFLVGAGGIVSVAALTASSIGYTIVWPLTLTGCIMGTITGFGMGCWAGHPMEGVTSGVAIGSTVGLVIAVTPYIFPPTIAAFLIVGATGVLLGDCMGYDVSKSLAAVGLPMAITGAAFASVYCDEISGIIGVAEEETESQFFDFS